MSRGSLTGRAAVACPQDAGSSPVPLSFINQNQRGVSMDCDINLGSAPLKHAERDAIHIPVISVTAGSVLSPGDHIEMSDGVATKSTSSERSVGIIDPFLRNRVQKGDTVWLLLYPKSIRSLRHHWTHPLFPSTDYPDGSDYASEQRQSEAWLREYASKMNCYDGVDKAFNNLIDGLKRKDLFAHGTDLHGQWELEDADDLKFHAERFLGIRINWSEFEFSCSC